MNVISYIAGFNLYYGLKSNGWRKYYWLDLWALSERFLKANQTLIEVVYCPSKVKNDPAAIQRQLTFLDALQSHRPGVKVVFGHFLAKDGTCRQCGNTFTRHEEKKTDVNIACHLLTDAMDCRFDVALLLSADSDLVPPVEIVRQRWPQKKVIAVFPPKRYSDALRQACNAQTWIGADKLRQSQLPASVTLADGKVASRPQQWT
jgi:uncharacterized LabA/DUF88 family protein